MPPLTGVTSSNDNLPLLPRTLQGLVESQSKNHGVPSRLPTRLIDVSEALSGEYIKLVESREVKTERYIALSYCWGQDNNYKLVQENYAELRLGLDLSKIPLTLRHAITVTAKLKFGYIWIDSLCIIQDSTPDWDREAASMCDVYQNASLTLAATSAKGSGDGMFCEIEVLASSPCFITKANLGRWSALNFRASNSTLPYYMLPCRMNNFGVESDIDLSVWNNRAWCFQERCLSRNILHFGTSQVYLEMHDGDGGRFDIVAQCDERTFGFVGLTRQL